MGAFSRKKTIVNTYAQQVFTSETLKNPAKSAVLRALVWGTDYSDEFKREIDNGIHRKIENAFKYAKNGNYYYGTPDLQHFAQNATNVPLLAVLEDIYGAGVTLEYVHLGELHPLFAGFDLLCNQYAWVETDNIIGTLTTEKGTQVFLDDMVPHYRNSTYADLPPEDVQWIGPNPRAGITPERMFKAAFAIPMSKPVLDSSLGVEIHYTWVNGTEIQNGMDAYDLSAYEGKDYIQALFRTASGEFKAWKYETGVGTYPTLDSLTDITLSPTGDYFPFIPFRAFRQDQTAEALRTTDAYLTATALVKKLGMSYQEISDQVHSSPDINDIEQAVMTLAVPGDSEDQVDLEYLFAFFSRLADSPSNVEHTQAITTYGRASPAGNSNMVRWSDAGFEMRLSFYKLSKTNVTGTVCETGKYILLVDEVSFQESLLNPDYDPNNAESLQYITDSWKYPVFKYCFQVMDGLYTEVSLVGALMQYPIDDTYTTEFYSDSETFLIPVDMSIARTLHWRNRQQLYHNNLRIIFNAKIIQKLAWYQTGAFKFFMTALAITAAVFGLAPVAVSISTMIQVGTYALLAATLADLALNMIILKLLFTYIVKVVGPEFALIAAIVMYAAGLGQATGVNIPGGMPATAYIELATGLTQGIDSNIKKAFSKYNEEYKSFLEEKESKLEEMEKVEKELNLSLLDSPFTDRYLVPSYFQYETPSEFFYRTSGTGNVGTVAFKSIENFVFSSLKLPDIDYDPRIEVI